MPELDKSQIRRANDTSEEPQRETGTIVDNGDGRVPMVKITEAPVVAQAPVAEKPTRRDVEQSGMPFTADDYQPFKTPLPMHTITQAAAEVERSWQHFTKADYQNKLTNISLFSTPAGLGERMYTRPGALWAQTIQGPTKEIGPRPGGKQLSAAAQILSTVTGSGPDVTLFMPASGFYVSFQAPDESALCDYDFTWGLEASIVGVSTTGMLLNASSGIYLAHQFNFALDHAVDSTIVHNKDTLRTTLMNRLDEQDYGLFVLGPLIAKFLGGFPFTLECAVGTCNHQRDTKINLSRIVNYDRNLLTARQLEIAEKCNTSSSMTDALYNEYKAEHKKVKESRAEIITVGDAKVFLELEHCNIGRYLEMSSTWVKGVEEANNTIMSSLATEVQRRKHLNTRAEARRLLRYQHMVKAIVTVNGDGVEDSITNVKEIERYLTEFSSKPSLAHRIEEKIEEFIVASQLSLIGYMAYECESCKTAPAPGEEFITISPDTLFFTLAQQVSSLFKALANPEELSGQ